MRTQALGLCFVFWAVPCSTSSAESTPSVHFENCSSITLAFSTFDGNRTFIHLTSYEYPRTFILVDNKHGRPLLSYNPWFIGWSLGTFRSDIGEIGMLISRSSKCRDNDTLMFQTLLRVLPGKLKDKARTSSLCHRNLSSGGFEEYVCCQLAELLHCDTIKGSDSEDTVRIVVSVCLTLISPLVYFYLIPRLEQKTSIGLNTYIGLTEATPMRLTHPVHLLISIGHYYPVRGCGERLAAAAVIIGGSGCLLAYFYPPLFSFPNNNWLPILLGFLAFATIVPVLYFQATLHDVKDDFYEGLLELPEDLRLNGRTYIEDVMLHRISLIVKPAFWDYSEKYYSEKSSNLRRRATSCLKHIWCFLLLTPVVFSAVFSAAQFGFLFPSNHSCRQLLVLIAYSVTYLLWVVCVFSFNYMVLGCFEYTIKGLVKNHSYEFVDILLVLFVGHFILKSLSKDKNQYIHYKNIIFETVESFEGEYPRIWVMIDDMPVMPELLYNHVIDNVFPVAMRELKVLGKITLGVILFSFIRKSIDNFGLNWSAMGAAVVSTAIFALPSVWEYTDTGEFMTDYRLKHKVKHAIDNWLRLNMDKMSDGESLEKIQNADDDETHSHHEIFV